MSNALKIPLHLSLKQAIILMIVTFLPENVIFSKTDDSNKTRSKNCFIPSLVQKNRTTSDPKRVLSSI